MYNTQNSATCLNFTFFPQSDCSFFIEFSYFEFWMKLTSVFSLMITRLFHSIFLRYLKPKTISKKFNLHKQCSVVIWWQSRMSNQHLELFPSNFLHFQSQYYSASFHVLCILVWLYSMTFWRKILHMNKISE